MDNISDIDDKKINEIILHLSRLELFSDFSIDNKSNAEFLKRVTSLLTIQVFEPNEVIINEHDVVNNLYILFEGEVQILRTTFEGSPFAITNLKAEQNIFFAEAALVEAKQPTTSVKAVDNCICLLLDSQSFLKLCSDEPKDGCKILYRLSQRLAKALCSATKDSITLYQALLDEVSAPL